MNAKKSADYRNLIEIVKKTNIVKILYMLRA